MSDYISREDAVDELQVKVFHNLTDEYYGTMQVLTELPTCRCCSGETWGVDTTGVSMEM